MERAKEIGADFVINYNKEIEWWKKVQEITNKKGADIIVEVGGSKTLEQSIKCSKTCSNWNYWSFVRRNCRITYWKSYL